MIMHEGARFRCYQCEYWSAKTEHMKRHLKNKHASKKPNEERIKASSEKLIDVSSDSVVASEEVLCYEAGEIEIKLEPGLEEQNRKFSKENSADSESSTTSIQCYL